MTTITHTQQPPHAVVWTLANAVVASRCLHIAAELGVADHVDAQPVPAADLAERCGADADALERALQLIAAHGVFEAVAGGFRRTGCSRATWRQPSPGLVRESAKKRGQAVRSGATS
jgi:hypothetical protein